MMTSGAENVGSIRSYQESLSDFTKYMMENPGKSLTMDLRMPESYRKTNSEIREVEDMNDHLKNLRTYNKFNLIRDDGGVFMSRITYDADQTLAYADVISLNGALGEISSAIFESENSIRRA